MRYIFTNILSVFLSLTKFRCQRFCLLIFVFFESSGCDRTLYETKRKSLEDKHEKRLAAVSEAWEEAERRYKILKLENFAAAKNNMTSMSNHYNVSLCHLEIQLISSGRNKKR